LPRLQDAAAVGNLMGDVDQYALSSTVTQSIEDAIVFGHVRELDIVLDRLEGDMTFPDTLRYGLQALRYFRTHYGEGGMIAPQAPLQKQKIAVMESAWSAQLLDMVRHTGVVTEKRA
jgi:hypothetical protein